MAVETPTWKYKLEGDKQTASEMNQLAQSVIANAIELSNTKNGVANVSNDVSFLENRLTTIEESVTNLADDDDLENTIINGAPVIREKTTKTYNPGNYSGMGRVILRKNMVNGVNVLTQEMINQANTIYEIRYDFDLNGQTITIPDNCILLFEGGKVTTGVLNLTNTNIVIPNYSIDDYITSSILGTYKIGQVFYNKITNQLEYYNGTDWINMDGTLVDKVIII